MTSDVRRVTYLLIRHGEAEGNREHRFIGQMNVPLSELGRRQAELVSQRLTDAGVTRIVSSDLSRATDTVAPLTSAGVPIRLDDRLREINNGEWGGKSPEEIEAGWPEMWERYRQGEDVPRPGGERWIDVQTRAVAAIEADAANASDGDVVAVSSHGGTSMSILLWALGITLDGGVFRGPFAPLRNASVSTLLLPSRRIGSVNDVGHLGPLTTDARLRFLDA